ncbi:MAG: DNA repair protein RecO [Bacteroidota bacterium]
MLLTVSGIVLHQYKYSESSIIVKVYTRELGLISFIVKGSRNKKSVTKASLFSHLLILEIQFNHKPKVGLQQMKEARPMAVLNSIYSDIRKSAIALFINELISKAIREEEKNELLWDFIKVYLLFFEEIPTQFSDFHLIFMVKLTRLLGFSPNGVYGQHSTFFDLTEGVFLSNPPLGNPFLDYPLSYYFSKLDEITLENYQAFVPLEFRAELLEKLMEYYKIHLPGFGNMKSHIVLAEVFS